MAAAARHGKTAALFLANPQQAAGFRQFGFTLFACTFESAILAAGSAAAARDLRV